MHLVSSAQNQEDIMLWRALRHVGEGFYIDVGAADPVESSVSRLFYDRGWRGINLEPDGTYFAALSRVRPRDINLCVAAGTEAGVQLFHDIEGSGLSTFDADIAAGHRENGWRVVDRPVQILTLAEICRSHRPQGPIHFLKVDAEGSERAVLEGADFTHFRPWITLVEATRPNTQIPSYDDWEELLIGNDYEFVWFDGLNRFYVAAERAAELAPKFDAPPNVFDGFESAASVLMRAETAERMLGETRAAQLEAAGNLRAASEMLRQTTATLRKHAVLLASQSKQLERAQAGLADAAARHQDAERRLTQARDMREALAAQLADKESRLAAAEHMLQARDGECADLRQLADRAEARVTWLLSSTSWRLTAPLRAVRRLLSSRIWRRARGTIADTQRLRRAARSVLARTVKLARRVPGSRRAARAVHAAAPGLAARLRAYAREIAVNAPPQPDLPGHPSPSGLGADASEQEMRIFHVMAALGHS